MRSRGLMEQADTLAQRYGVTPAVLLGVDEPFKAASINLHAAVAGVNRQNREQYKAQVAQRNKWLSRK